MIEVEQKYRVPNPESILARLELADFRPALEIKQVDAYYQHPSRNFAQTDEAFRLRQDGDQFCVSYKGPKQPGPCKQRFELELPLEPTNQTQEDWHELLTRLSFQFVAQVVKFRQCFYATQHPNLTVMIDRLQTGNEPMVFCEIEVLAEQNETEAAARAIESLASSLELDQIVKKSYLKITLDGQV